MKFRNLGQILLASVVSVGLCLGVTSCATSFTVGFLYVVGASTTNGISGQISGYKIDNDTGRLTQITRSPFSSAGAHPIRAVVFPGGRFLYVLNAEDGVHGDIAQFTIGGDGVLAFQAHYFSQGSIPVSIAADSGGKFLYALDQEVHDSSGNVVNSGNGAITVFAVDANTGRLSLVTNQQVFDPAGAQLTYFPVGKKPVAFGPIVDSQISGGGYIFTVDSFDQTIFPYGVGPNGQLVVTANGPQPTGAARISVIGGSSKTVYLLDAGTVPSTIMPYTIGPNGSLQTLVGGNFPNDATLTNPSDLVVVSGKFLYIANAGPNVDPNSPASKISGYDIDPLNGRLSIMAGQPFGSGSSPRCILLDPSKQFLYTANFNDSTVTGRVINSSNGELTDMRRGSSFPATGQPTWCVASSRTQ